MREGVLGCCVLLLAGGLLQADPPQTSERDKTMTTLTSMANFFRMEASENVEQAVRKWGTSEFALKWNREVMTLFEKEELIEWQDFFSSAVIWGGRILDREGVAALYSPWIDGLILLRVQIDGAKSRFSDFRVISGEALRKEALPEEQSVARTLRLYAGPEIPTLALARLYAGSLKAFNAHFPLESKPDLNPAGFAKNAGSSTQETALIKTRMLYRMSMFKEFFGEEKNRSFVAATGHLLKAFEADESKATLARLSSDQPKEIVDTVFEMPQAVRASFAPNFFGTRDRKALVGLVSPLAPQWILMVKIENRPDRAPSLMMEALALEASTAIVEQADKEAK